MFCSCHEDIEINDFDVIKPNTTVTKIVEKINSYTDHLRNKCSEFHFKSINKLYERIVSRTDTEYQLGDSSIFIIQIYVNPGEALFETVIRNFDNNTKTEVVGEMSRINLYGKQADCLKDKLLKNYCFCNIN